MSLGIRLVVILWVALLSQSCSLYVQHLSRHDFQSPESALLKAKDHLKEFDRILSVPRDVDSLKWGKKDREEMGARIDRLFSDGDFNGADLCFWEFSSGNIDSCDDGWEFHHRVLVDPRVKTKRGLFGRLPRGQYKLTGAGGEPPFYASRGIAVIEGERRYEYCYDMEALDADTWMRYFFVGEPVEVERQ